MDAALQRENSPSGAPNHHGATAHQDTDETTPSDASERPSVDDVESETGSTGALETRSLKDHKGKLSQEHIKQWSTANVMFIRTHPVQKANILYRIMYS